MGDFLFGSEPSQDITPAPTLTPEQEELLRKIIAEISGGVGDTGFGIESGALELQSLAGLEALGSSIPGLQSQGSTAAAGAATAGLGALESLFTQGPQDIGEFFEETIQKPAVEAFNRDIIPGIRTRFAPQFFGGERREAEARAGEDLIDALTRERARVGFEARDTDQLNILRGLQTLPGAGGFATTQGFQGPTAQANILLGLLGAGGTTRNVVQQQLDERNRRMREAFSSLNIEGFENIVFNDPGSTGFIPSLVSGAATGFATGFGGTF